jgi:hypothetical protein
MITISDYQILILLSVSKRAAGGQSSLYGAASPAPLSIKKSGLTVKPAGTVMPTCIVFIKFSSFSCPISYTFYIQPVMSAATLTPEHRYETSHNSGTQ